MPRPSTAASPRCRPFPPLYDLVRAAGVAIVGTPEQVREEIARQLRQTGANYLAGRFAFGDLTLAESMRSVELFAAEVIPGYRALAAQ